MRFSIECILEKDEISTSYNRKILSFFKKALEAYNKDIKKFFYDEPMEKEMTFSCYFFIEKIENNKIKLRENNFKIFITFNSIIDGIHFYNAFLEARANKIEFNIGDNNSFKIKNITKIKEKEINGTAGAFKLLSPLVIREKREGKKDWYHFLDEKGIEVLKNNLYYSLREKFSKDILESLEIIPLDVKNVIVNFYDIKFNTTKGLIALKGNRELLDYFYKSGIGSRKSSGYGMLELMS